MITNNIRKRIQALRLKKNRQREQLFVVEGKKAVASFLDSALKLHSLFFTDAFTHPQGQQISAEDMQRMSHLKNASNVLAVFSLPKETTLPTTGPIVVLDGVSDPGNLGTMIRLCDWFGIRHIVCSADTVDCFNPKVVQATMGSLANVRCHYTDLVPYLETIQSPIYGTFMEGTSVYDLAFPRESVFVFGSEAHGISPPVKERISMSMTIPKSSSTTAESLNVAMAAGVVLGVVGQQLFKG